MPATSPERYAAVVAYNAAFIAAVQQFHPGCSPVTLTTDRRWVQVIWSNSATMAAEFTSIAEYGGMVEQRNEVEWGPFADTAIGYQLWFATDVGNADEVGRVWLHMIGHWAGLPDQIDDPYQITYNHPTWSTTPVADLVQALRNAQLLQGMCPQ